MIKQEEIQETLLRLCKHYGEQNWWQSDNKIEDLVSTILIQRTTEKNAKLAFSWSNGCHDSRGYPFYR